ncbi:hypothetical protein [Notoacmeibacter ruber]|uniref:Uncharacterized protein n=1 Tax=Notoacmeibacter ruber TaxID=2670375 RepID=A0A3L7JCL3_9HYPH|nr:hypothetical protein [Notoacmeibacter ruber]RLQ88487.1 hypothetical protein D8780_09980 [Notoacmeibacter ruber]
MNQIAVGPGLAEQIVSLDRQGLDRIEIARWLQSQGLPPEQASVVVAEVLEAEAMGEMAREGPAPRRAVLFRVTRGAVRFILAAAFVLAASSLVAWLSAFLPTVFDWIGLYGIGLLFGRLVATVAGVVFALIGIVMAADGKDFALMAGALSGAAGFYGFVLQWGGF